MTKITDVDARKRFVRAISIGAAHIDACNYAGFTESCYHIWKNEVKKYKETGEICSNIEIKVEFFDEIKKAEGDAVIGWLDKIEAAGAKDWPSMAWKLERRHPDRYGRDSQLIKELINNLNILAKKGANGNGEANNSETKENTKE